MKNKKDLGDKILKGITKAFRKLIETSKLNDDYLVFSENGKIVRIKARKLK